MCRGYLCIRVTAAKTWNSLRSEMTSSQCLRTFETKFKIRLFFCLFSIAGSCEVTAVLYITACAVATSCCISDVPSQWEGRNFDPPTAPTFSTDLNETWNRGYDPTGKIWLMWEGGLRREGIFRYFLCSILFCIFCPRLQVTPEERSRPLMAQNACFRVR